MSSYLHFNSTNRITVQSRNRLTNYTVPQGKYYQANGQDYPKNDFSYFYYSGIHGSVHLYTTPYTYIKDVQLNTNVLSDGTGLIDYNVYIADFYNLFSYMELYLYNKAGGKVVHETSLKITNGTLKVPNATLWWPHLMHERPGYMYTLNIILYNSNSEPIDEYPIRIGIRSLSWNNTGLFINKKRLYLHGVNKHEDSQIRGRGLNPAVMVHDFSLLKFINANVYRTTHYPHSEESMQLADELGIMIIDECPSIKLNTFSSCYLGNHKIAMRKLIQRDRNHPSVIAWSFGHEPLSNQKPAQKYFSELRNHSLEFHKSRPFTAGTNIIMSHDYMTESLDIIGFVRYNGWFSNYGQLDVIITNVVNQVKEMYSKYQKPIIMIEYGIEALEGYRENQAVPWSEEYQWRGLLNHFEAFKKLQKQKWFIGELVQSFTDFRTQESIQHKGYNRMGMFTRARKWKYVSSNLRIHYNSTSNQY